MPRYISSSGCINTNQDIPDRNWISSPGRAIRELVGRCLVGMYTRGETRSMFDIVQSCMRIVGDFKSLSERDASKIAAFSCIGDIMASFGSQVMSFMAEICTTTLRTVKSSSSVLPLLRYQALITLRKSLTTAKRAVTDSLAKDIQKQMRSLLTDKSFSVQREQVLINLYTPETTPTLPEIDTLISNSLRSLEQADQLTRLAHANLTGHILASTQIERVIPVPESSSEEGEEVGTAQVQEVTKPLCTPQEMLLHLSNLYNRTLTRKVRVGIFDFYASLFTHLGPRSGYDILLTRTLVSILPMLSEQGQISAIKEMANSYLRRWPALMPGQTKCTRESLTDPLITLLSHPSHSVRIHTAHALRQFCNSTPTLLPRSILTIQEKLQRDLSSILNPSSAPEVSTRALGHAYGLASLVSLIPERPLYVSYDISAKVLDLASTLLKKAGESDTRVASIQCEIAWFLVLWRNALPKMTSKERELGGVPRPEVEFLLLLRGCAVGSILAFLKWNKGLVSLDVGRRVASVLSNALSFANAVVSLPLKTRSTVPKKKGLGMKEHEALLRKRVFLCFSSLGFNGIAESTQGALLKSCIGLFASPDGYAGSTFKDLWGSADGYAYGVSSIVLRKPIIPSIEHDPLSLFTPMDESSAGKPPPPYTAVVDSAIELFANTVKIITLLLENVHSPKLEKNTGRKAAVFVNAVVALLLAMGSAREVFGSDAIVDGDAVLRLAGSEAIGRLASLSSTNFLTGQIKDLVDTVVNNRDPYGRAGCALAFGSIYTHVGGLAAGPLLKTTVNVLMSLSNDPHPVVHFWALRALSRLCPFVPSTLGMLLKVSLLESHEREGGTLGNSNASGDCPAYPVVCQIIDAVITVLGPDIQESARTRTLILNLVNLFMRGDAEDEGIAVEAIKCIQHFLMFAPEHVDVPDLVRSFQAHLSSPRGPLKVASINALYQLVQKDALAMSRIGGDRLVEDLFGMLDDDATVVGVKDVISSWLKQTVVHNPSAWIDLCQRIMSRTTAAQQAVDSAAGRDDEGESLNLGLGSAEGRGRLTSRWRTQLFALQCLHDICTVVAESGRREHLNAVVARENGIPTKGLLFTRVADLIRMAFTASTAYVTEIRLEGLVVLQDVIQIFAESPDPAYDDALLLEQHQAPITAALTPAFSGDSTPEILASAVHACAVFVGCGVVKDVARMGRILKLLTTALEQSKEAGMLSVGDSGELSPNASAMLRISTLSAWAQLQVSSEHQVYLQKVVEPYRPTLSSLWISSLRDYASIRIDSESLNDSSVALDSSYSNLGKEVLLPYYNQSWPIILEAVATTMQAGDPHILAAMDGRELAKNETSAPPTKRDEPTALFFVVYGLVYEALTTSSADSITTSSVRETMVISALKALKSLVRPEYSGNAIMEPTIFDEFMGLCYRMAMTEPANVQVHLVEVVGALASTRSPTSTDSLSFTSPRAHCLRICAHIVKHCTSSSRGSIIQGQAPDRLALVNAAFASFIAIASSIKSSQREDVRGVSALLYCDILKDESSEIDLAGPTFPALKSIIDLPVANGKDNERYNQLMHALLSSCLHNVDEMRGRQGLISAKKTRNNLLAAVLILTVVPSSVKVGRAALEHCCFLISQKLLDADEISLTAAHCAKTLVLASAAGNSILRQCTRLLLPGLVEFLAKMSPLVHDGSITEAHVTAIGEVWKALSGFFSSVGEDHRARVLGVLLPTISLLLLSPQVPSTPLNTQTVTQLLSFATTSPAAFKEAAEKLDPSTRELLEHSIRRAVGGTATAASQPASKPQISLRSF
ncbi:armadillo-type protein [Cyathus striatus]|nr:armadillo-type protein [Cyathus striatus]